MQQTFQASTLVPRGFVVADTVSDGGGTSLTVRSTAKASTCPGCGTRSDRVHSRYRRRLADLPIARVFRRMRSRPPQGGFQQPLDPMTANSAPQAQADKQHRQAADEHEEMPAEWAFSIGGIGRQASGQESRRREKQPNGNHSAAVSSLSDAGRGVMRRAVPPCVPARRPSWRVRCGPTSKRHSRTRPVRAS